MAFPGHIECLHLDAVFSVGLQLHQHVLSESLAKQHQALEVTVFIIWLEIQVESLDWRHNLGFVLKLG